MFSLFLPILVLMSIVAASAQTAPAPAESGDRKAGAVRVGLVNVKTTSVGEGMNAQGLGAGVHSMLAEYLKAPGIEIVPIEAKLASQIPAEAKEKKCDYLVFVTAAHKKGGGGFGKMFGAVAPALGQVAPMAGMAGGIGGAVAGTVATTAVMTAASMSGSVKSKDSLQFDLLIQKDGANVLTKQYKAKAKSDGEDIITPMIEQMAQLIVDTATGKATTLAAPASIVPPASDKKQ
jgi:hypothetical protein